MAEGNKTVLYIGLGCGGLALLGLCAFAGVGALMMLGRAESAAPVAMGPSAGPALAPPDAVTPAGFRSISGQGWSFAVPADWQDVFVPRPALVGVRAPDAVDGFYANVNLVTEPFAGDGATYAAASVQALTQHGSQVVGQQPSTVGALSATDVEAMWPRQIPPTHTLQRYTATSGTGYVLTCSGAFGSFETVRARCQEILGTFRVGP